MDNEKLLLLVQANECLYNKYCSGYKIPDKKRNAWKQISAEMEYPEEICQKRWSCLRDRYVKEKRQENLPSGSGAKYPSQWPLTESMKFIAPHVVPRPMRCSSNIYKQTLDIDSQSSSQSLQSAISPPTPISMSPPLEMLSDSMFETISTASTTPSIAKRKRSAEENNDVHFSQAVDAFTKLCESKMRKPEEEDAVTAFGKMIVATIRTMSKKKQMAVMQKVTTLVMEINLQPDE